MTRIEKHHERPQRLGGSFHIRGRSDVRGGICASAAALNRCDPHRLKCGCTIVLGLLLALSAVASADIVKWTDDAGVVHYTNLKGEVPSQESVQVVVDEQVWLPQGPALPDAKIEAAAAPPDPVAPPQAPRDTGDEVASAYLAGLDRGLADNTSTGGSVYIDGPLAVTVSSPPAYGSDGPSGYDWLAPGYFYPGYSPFFPVLTTAVIGRQREPLHHRSGGQFPSPPFTSAAGPPPLGAAGPPPIGAAGPPPIGAAGGQVLRVSGSRSLH